MAERRMFAKRIIDSDAFIDMPSSAQCLYFHMAMRADDDGFINSPKTIMRMIGASEDDLRILLAKQFIIAFETGIVVIKHWRIHNYIQSDRYKKTTFYEEKDQLATDQTNAYVYKTDTGCIQGVSKMDTQVRLGKDRLGKDNNKKTEIDAMIDEYSENLILRSTLIEFAKSRKALRKPMTSNALKLILVKLDKLASTDQEKIAIVEQSIERGWAGVFPIEQGKRSPKEEKKTSYDLNEWEDYVKNFDPTAR